MKGKKGFSLIELLVVIAIISILAAILFPVITSAKDKSKAAACLNHQKQIGAATMMYVDDNNGYYPKVMPANSEWKKAPAGRFSISNGLYYGYKRCWMDCIYPYAKSVQVFRCPAAPRRGSGDGQAYNFAFSTVLWYHPTYGWRNGRMSALPTPARVIMIGQASWDYIYILPEQFTYSKTISDWKYCFNHNQGTNIIYADGHARWHSVNDDCLYKYTSW